MPVTIRFGLRWWTAAIIALSLAICGTGAQKPELPQAKRESDDFTDPKKTFDVFLRAIRANDLAKAKACYTISGDDASRVLDVAVGMWIVFHRFSETARSNLGERAWAELQEWNGNIARDDCTNEAIDRTRAHLNDAILTTKKDTTELLIKWGAREPLQDPVFHYSGDSPIAFFRQVKGSWKLDFHAETGLEKAGDFFKPGTWGPMFRDQMQIVEEIRTNLERSKLTTAQQTIDAFEARMAALENKYDPAGAKERAAWRQKEKQASSVKLPSATDIPTDSLAWVTNGTPIIAVSTRGILYVFWFAKGRERSPDPVLPLIPTEFAFGLAKDPTMSEVPGVNVNRDGNWSKPALLVEGKRWCTPVFAWCEGELLHLLVSGDEATNHLVLDPDRKSWKRLARLPIRICDQDAFRQLGSAVHVAAVDGMHVSYLWFNGSEWSMPLRIKGSEKTRGFARPRLAVDKQGTAYVGWSPKGGLAAVHNGQESAIPFQFADRPIHEGEFDLGIAPNGALLVAYQAALADGHADAKKIHVRKWEGEHWTAPELIGGEGSGLDGGIRVFGNDCSTLVTWLVSEDYPLRGGVLAKTLRRLAVTDGKTWTPSRWMARQQSLRGQGVPETALDVAAYVASDGKVYMVWDPCAYCMVYKLDMGGLRRP
jgi:hypothetical protein